MPLVSELPVQVTVDEIVVVLRALTGFGEALAVPEKVGVGGGGGAVPVGRTKRVTLCAGRVVVKLPPETATSVRRPMLLAAVSCHGCAVPPLAKLARFTVTVVEPERTLFTSTSVRAPSLARVAAKAERLSGFGAAAETLVSPKADLF